MFTKNTTHQQRDLFEDILLSLPEAKRQKALASKEYAFYQEVYCQIDESTFVPLFPSQRGRPNSPVNAMAAALVLRELRHWTYEELFRSLDFDMLTRLALGLSNMSDTPFCPATLFNFQQRIVRYEQECGKNLFEALFQHLTTKQLKRFGVDTRIQRSDSFRAMSNIANYGRVRLLVEVLLRLYRILTTADRSRFAEILKPYTEQSSENFVYRLEDAELPRELGKLATIYAQLYAELGNTYAEDPVYQVFTRALREQFDLSGDGAIRVRERKELDSGTLQSPDDTTATYNAKNGKPQKGHKVNVAETAVPENKLNLINDVGVTPNNVHDGTMLAERMDTIKEQTPDLAEMHTDGGYGGAALDPKMAEHKVLHVETGTQMGHARVNMRYDRAAEGGYTVTCPCQTVVAEPTKTRWRAVFAGKACGSCPHAGQCPAEPYPDKRIFYFEESWAKSSIRSRNIEQIPKERRKIRANVEATVKEFTGCFNHKGKLRVRGLLRTRMQMLLMAMAINFGRIFRYQTSETGNAPVGATFSGMFLGIVFGFFLCLRRQFDQNCLPKAFPFLFPRMYMRTELGGWPELSDMFPEKAII